MILVNVIILFLAITNGVKPEDAMEWGSGDGKNPTSTTGSLYLIDENGDIPSPSTETPEPIDNISAESESELMVDRNLDGMKGDESVTLMTNIDDDEAMTTSFPTPTTDTYWSLLVTTDKTTAETTSTDLPTTETTTESDTTTTTFTSTTSSPTSTTEVSTTNFEEVSTVTTKQTTTFISKTTMMGKTEKSTGHIPQSSTTAETPSHGDRELCEPVNMDFHCHFSFQCYGEGEIDCLLDGDELTTHKIPSSSISEDDSDYGGTIGTFPPDLVGVASPKNFPFFYNSPFSYNRRSFRTTTVDVNETSETVEDNSSTVTADTTEKTSTLGSLAKSEPIDEAEDSALDTTTSDPDFTSEQSTTITETTSELLGSKGTFYETSHGYIGENDDDSKNGDMSSKNSELVMTTTEEMITSPSTQEADDATLYESTEEQANSRWKRSVKDRVLQLIEKKYTDFGLCRLSGNIVCFPRPTYADCRGKTVCKVPRRTPGAATETAETSRAKGLQTWVIVVITICAFFGLMTVLMIVYLLVTSVERVPACLRGRTFV